MHSSGQRGEAPAGGGRWSEARAEAQLRSLELFGMRFGLDRMRRMMTALGSPERKFDTIQVLGTNGKSSTTRMTAAILQRHGLRTGAYTSPHLIAYRERVLIAGQEIEVEDFAAGIARGTHAAEQVNRTLSEDDHVTQFELLTAAALWVMAEQGVEVAVIEAGLGGRYDATSVIDAQVTVLTNVGLEHTRWLGPTIHDIAEEKLAVVRPDGALVLGEGLAEAALEVAERIAAERGAQILHPAPPAVGLQMRSPGAFQRRNFALARASAAAYLDRIGQPLDEGAVIAAAAETHIPGRLQRVSEHPPTVIDGAHNPAAVEALLETLPEAIGGSPVALVLGVLDDKDAAEMLRMLLPTCEHAWFTAPPSERALPPAALESLARQLDFERVTCQARPDRALTEAQAWALEHDAVVLACGSVYLVGALLEHLQGSHASRFEGSDTLDGPRSHSGSSA
jgi:dihydrofolate synthase/folylpolyglutamate synthase